MNSPVFIISSAALFVAMIALAASFIALKRSGPTKGQRIARAIAYTAPAPRREESRGVAAGNVFRMKAAA